MKISVFCKYILYSILKRITKAEKYAKYQFHAIAVKDGKEKLTPIFMLPKNIKIKIRGYAENTVKIHLPADDRKLLVLINFSDGRNNNIEIHEKCYGNFYIFCHGDGNSVKIGKGSSANSFTCYLIKNSLEIGEDCLMSTDIRCWGDGHSVLDCGTKKLLNPPPPEPIKIGNHVWIGERVTLTKNAQIADNSIVGIASVVTKKFTESNVVIAGSPARIVKKGITWDIKSPSEYSGIADI